jgi:hypothetical protein
MTVNGISHSSGLSRPSSSGHTTKPVAWAASATRSTITFTNRLDSSWLLDNIPEIQRHVRNSVRSEDSDLLRCAAVSLGEQLQTFRSMYDLRSFEKSRNTKQWHGITSHRTWIFSNVAVRTLNLAVGFRWQRYEETCLLGIWRFIKWSRWIFPYRTRYFF